MSLLYNFGIQLYHLSILVASIFNKKASLMIKGRKGLLNNIKSQINKNDNIIWFHCASLGEFEQGRPLIESIKKKYPDKKILLTFFSPSAYEIKKNYSQADYIFYLPFDTKNNAKKFIKIVNPKIAIFVKYEYWFN
ncbi:3-deoxy-D-manno-octulosonic acid transferase, partial [candidate division TA06 bacterium]